MEAYGQKPNPFIWVDSIIQEILHNQELDAATKSMLADSAYNISLKNNDLCRQVYSRTVQTGALDQMGLADSALTQLYWAQGHFRKDCDSLIYFNIQEIGRAHV